MESVELAERVCAIDIGKAGLVACVRVPDDTVPARRTEEVREYPTTTPALLGLADWLRCQQIELVAMEATSDYWKPVFYLLEAEGFTCLLLNARHGWRVDPCRGRWEPPAVRSRLCSMTTGTGEPPVVRRRRWGLVPVALSAGAVLVIAGGALLAVRLVNESDQATGAGGGRLPAELTINGKTVHRQGATPIVSVQATDRAATRLLVLACCENPAVPDPCHPWTDVRVVGQDDRTITLAATTYVDRTGGPDVACSAGGRGGGRFSVPLAAPLETRRVVQDGRVLPVQLIDSLLHATVLPAGYAAPPRVEKDTQAPGLTSSTYSGPDQDTRIEIYQGPVDQPPTDPRGSAMTVVLGRLTVRGHPAVFRQTGGFPDAGCLVWAETASTGVAVCSRGLPAAPLSAAQLAIVAEGLVRK